MTRVFVLGAGFSKPAGFPLATELTNEVLDELRDLVGDDYDLFSFVEHVRKLHQWISRSQTIPLLNIEEFYEYASVYAERFRFEQHRTPVGRHDGDGTPYSQAETLETWLSYLDEHLLDVLLKHEHAAKLDAVNRFVSELRPGDTVVTFNYDRLIERCLTEQGKPWSFGFEENPASDKVLVLKMHGSVDWICFARSERVARKKFQLLFSKVDENRARQPKPDEPCGEDEYDWELFHVEDDASLRSTIENRSIIQCSHRWGVAGLGPQKRVSLIPGLGVVWERARRALYNADKIAIVGFSFSSYDRLAQIEFARVAAGRDEAHVAPPEVVVVDPALQITHGVMSESGASLIRRVESVFRPVKPVGLLHEQFDWTSLR